MRLVLYVAMVWLAVSIPVGLFLGRLCALQDHEPWPSHAGDADSPSVADLGPMHNNFTPRDPWDDGMRFNEEMSPSSAMRGGIRDGSEPAVLNSVFTQNQRLTRAAYLIRMGDGGLEAPLGK